MSDGPFGTSWALEGQFQFGLGDLKAGKARTGAVGTVAQCMQECFDTSQCNYISTSVRCAKGDDEGAGLDLCPKQCYLWESVSSDSRAIPPADFRQNPDCAQVVFPAPSTPILHTVWQKQTRAGADLFAVVEGVPEPMVDHIPTCRYSVPSACHDAAFLCTEEPCVTPLGTNMGNAYGAATTYCGQGSSDCDVGFVVDSSNQFYAMIPSSHVAWDDVQIVNGPTTCTTPGGSGACEQCTSPVLKNRYFTYIRARQEGGSKTARWVVKINGQTVQVAPPPPPSLSVKSIIFIVLGALVIVGVLFLLVWRSSRRRRARAAKLRAAKADNMLAKVSTGRMS